VLSILRGPRAGQWFALAGDAVTAVGRHTDSHIALMDVTVSRRHAETRPEGGRFVLVDLGSLNGSFVNHAPIDTVVLADGDELAFGVFRLSFHTDGQRPRPDLVPAALPARRHRYRAHRAAAPRRR
jgi:pSer/pThr/pTyr-binding forkhead associated (FHA) protein